MVWADAPLSRPDVALRIMTKILTWTWGGKTEHWKYDGKRLKSSVTDGTFIQEEKRQAYMRLRKILKTHLPESRLWTCRLWSSSDRTKVSFQRRKSTFTTGLGVVGSIAFWERRKKKRENPSHPFPIEGRESWFDERRWDSLFLSRQPWRLEWGVRKMVHTS